MSRKSTEDIDNKFEVVEEVEDTSVTPGATSSNTPKDAALEILGDQAVPLHISPEDDRKVLRKIDLWLMPVLMTVYFIQQLDKYVSWYHATADNLTSVAQVISVIHFSLRYRSGCP